jgi:S-adenosyl-L-methionine hydrolase (adenosine-forming)
MGPMAGRRPKPAHARGTEAWKPSGIVTLLTDFGTEDPYVGMMKGVILSAAPRLSIVDLSHGVPPQNLRVGAWFLAHASAFFPPGSVHLAVVDPGVGSGRKLLVAEDQGHAYLAPDNGILGPVLTPAARVYELDPARFARSGASRTFHGRDILAPAAAALASGLAPKACGSGPVVPAGGIAFPRPRQLAAGRLECEVLLADRYGNLILSARPADLGRADRIEGNWIVEVAGRRIPVRGVYAEAAPGELLALVDSYGALEIAVREGNAAARLGLRQGDTVILARSS